MFLFFKLKQDVKNYQKVSQHNFKQCRQDLGLKEVYQGRGVPCKQG